MSNYNVWRSISTGDEITSIPDSVVDNFNGVDDDPPGFYEEGEELDDYYSGDLSAFDRTTSTVIDGDHALRGDPDGTANQFIYSTGDNLNRYPQPGEEFSTLVWSDDGDQAPTMIFGVQDGSNFYNASLLFGGEDVTISKDGLTGDDEISRSSVGSVSSNTWYELAVEWETDGSITARVYDVDQSDGSRDSEKGSTSANDTDYDDGGFGFGMGSASGIGRFDRAEVVGSL